MPLSVTGIDHFVIRVADLDAGERLFTKLGFTLTPRGFHAGGGSANHTAPLSGGNYVELLYLGAGAEAARFFRRPEGPAAVALAPVDSRAIHVELTALGYDAAAPHALALPVHLPGGAREARFLNVAFPPIAPESVSFFACQQLTRDLVWRPEWEGHANGAERVTEIIIAHSSPAGLQGTYVKLFGEAAVGADGDGLVVMLGDDKISFLTGEAFTARFPTVPVPADISEGWFAGATLRVRSLDRVEDILSAAGVTCAHAPSGSIVLVPSEPLNTLFEFKAA